MRTKSTLFNIISMYYKKRLSIYLLCLLSCSTTFVRAIEEHQIKAAFLYNFANFTQWPNTTFAEFDSPFFICILGEDPFRDSIDIAVKDIDIDGHPIFVQRIHLIEDISYCQILFVSVSKADKLDQIFSYAKDYPILTVSDIKNFAYTGGMIEFFLQDSKVRFNINPYNVKRANLYISGNLLRVAKIVKNYSDF